MKLSRRSALKLSAAPVVAAAVPALADVPVNHIRHEGQHWPVNPSWHEANTAPFPHLAAMSIDDLETQVRDKLFRLADERAKFGGRLDEDERALLIAGRNHRNVRAGIIKVKGRPLSDFGFTGYDQVDHNGIRGFKCGCVLEEVYDGPMARAAVAQVLARMERQKDGVPLDTADVAAAMVEVGRSGNIPAFPHYPLFLCKGHRHLEGTEHAELHARVYADHARA